MKGQRSLVTVGLSLSVAACAHHATQRAPASEAPATTSLAFVPASADPARRDRLIALSTELDAHFRANVVGGVGAAVGIVLGGELVYARGFGVRDIDSGVPVDTDTVFRIASVSKSFTAAAVMRLRDEGRLRLDEPAATYLPELASLVGPARDCARFTVRHMLTMSSGLPYDDMWGPVTFGMSEGELTTLLQTGVPLAYAPGEQYVYSNLGYALLGRIVARLSGRPFREYVSHELLVPLGMKSTVWEAHDVPADTLATGYRREGEQLITQPLPSDGVFAAAGGLYTSLRDYARYVAFQLAAYPARDDVESGPLRRSTVREMHQGHRTMNGDDNPLIRRDANGKEQVSSMAYGFGWMNSTTCHYAGIVQHGGFEPGYWSSVHLLPRHHIGIVVLSTTSPVGLKTFDGTLSLLKSAGLLDAQPAASATPALLDAQSIVLRLIDRWDASLAQGSFDAKSQNYPWVQNIPQRFAQLKNEYGACRAPGVLRPRSSSEAVFELGCERGVVDVRVLLAPGLPPRLQMAEWHPGTVSGSSKPVGACEQ
jgi:CubicO group peptidase (beta-lactamase class C family)